MLKFLYKVQLDFYIFVNQFIIFVYLFFLYIYIYLLLVEFQEIEQFIKI